MSDAGAIGVILEDTIDVLKCMYERNELSEEKLRFALILINSINTNCQQQGIDLYLDEDYLKYIKAIVPHIF